MLTTQAIAAMPDSDLRVILAIANKLTELHAMGHREPTHVVMHPETMRTRPTEILGLQVVRTNLMEKGKVALTRMPGC